MNGTLRMAGTMELAGIDISITQRRVDAIRRSFGTFFPAFDDGDVATITPWAGLRPVSPDGMPYIGRTRVVKNLCVATGHSMLGVSLGAATGHIVAACIGGEKSPVPLDLVSPDRFA
jgi:D-amino-acid dehydrogenase